MARRRPVPCSPSPPRSSSGSARSAIPMPGGTSRRAPTCCPTGGSTDPIPGCPSRRGPSCSPSGYRRWLPRRVYSLFGLPAVAWLRCAAMLALISALVWAARQAADAVPAIMAALAGLIGSWGKPVRAPSARQLRPACHHGRSLVEDGRGSATSLVARADDLPLGLLPRHVGGRRAHRPGRRSPVWRSTDGWTGVPL